MSSYEKSKVEKEPIGDLIKKKNIENVSELFEFFKQKGIASKFESYSEYDNDFIRYSENYCNLLEDVIGEIMEHSDSYGGNLLACLANNSIRDFTLNFLNSYKLWLLFEQRSRDVTNKSRLLESIILNGRLYPNTRATEIDQPMGYLIPNIFWFKREQANGRWQGLCGYRILENLSDGTDIAIKKSIIESMVVVYNYSEEIVNERLQTFIKYGMITFDENTSDSKVTYTLTSKGKFVKEFAFSCIDVFYLLAIDTPLIAKVGRKTGNDIVLDSKEIECHYQEQNNLWAGYLSSSVRTSITLIRHILTYDEIDKKNAINSSRSDCGLPPNIFNKIVKDIDANINSLNRKHALAHKNLIHDLEGILEPQ